MNTIVLWYPAGSGGKFLINCLALSRHCHLQHSELIKQQATPIDKFTHLMNELELVATGKSNNVPGTWSDLGMGNDNIFDQSNCELLEPATIGDGIVFFTAHGHTQGLGYKFLKKYPKSTVILFTKFNKFIAWRSEHSNIKYDTLDIFEFPQVTNKVLEWSADCYLDTQTFLSSIKQLYSDLGLDDFNQELIEQFHNKYINTLANLNHYDNNL